MRNEMPLRRRLVSKLVHDILPAALASLIGGFLFSHLHLGRAPEPPAARPASAEMMQLLRDEHGLMANFLNAERAKEKAQLTAAAATTGVVGPPAEPPQTVVAAAVAKPPTPPTPHSKAPVVSASLPPLPAPLVIAQAQQTEEVKPVAGADDSLLAKTVGFKDHVVAVTQHVVSAIGGIPSWIGSIGDHIGGQDASPRPPAGLVSAS